MIRQLSSVCYEWTGGDFNVQFLDDPAIPWPKNVIPLKRDTAPAPASTGVRYTREELQPYLDVVEPILARYGRFDLCGSYRRGKPTVKDLDYVVECSQSDFLTLRQDLTAAGVVFHRGACEIMNGHIGPVPIDVFRADPHSYTMLLIWRTGSMEHNVYCARVARKRGMRVRRTGIETKDGMVYPATEAEFYEALGIPFLAPCDRDPR